MSCVGRAHLGKEAVEAVEQIGVSPEELFNSFDHLRGVAPADGTGRRASVEGWMARESSGRNATVERLLGRRPQRTSRS